jgi:hypothetical protein
VEGDYEGELLSVAHGKEHFQPLRFQGFDIGPFELQTRIRRGESVMEAKRRAMRLLEQMAQEEFEEKLERFLARVKKSDSHVL